MSHTTTAAESSSRQVAPSFDWVVATLPAELSPTNNGSVYPDTSYCFDDDGGHEGGGEEDSPPIDRFKTDDKYLSVHSGSFTPRVALNSRNTFVHFETASPLAKINNADLLQSFKDFSEKMRTKQVLASTTAEEEEDNQQEFEQQQPENFDMAKWLKENRSNLESGSLCDWIRDKLLVTEGDSTTGGYECIYLSPAASSLLNNNNGQQQGNDNHNNSSSTAVEQQQQLEEQQQPNSNKGFRDGHPTQCKPCAFFWSKGCLNGKDCLFCHQWHVPKRKKPMREQKNLMIIAKEDGKIAFLRCHAEEALKAA